MRQRTTAMEPLEFCDGAYDFMLFQCSRCKLTTPHKHVIVNHLPKCDSGARLVQAKRTCCTFANRDDLRTAVSASGIGINVLQGDKNHIENKTVTIQNVNIVLPAGSDAEYSKMLEVLRGDLADTLLSLDLDRPETWPAAIFSKLHAREPALRNVEVQGNMAIETRENGQKVPVPRMQKARKAQGALYETLGLAVETTPDDDDDVAYMSGKILGELRQRLPDASGTSLEEAARMYASRDPKFNRVDPDLQACVRDAARELAAAYPPKRRKCS